MTIYINVYADEIEIRQRFETEARSGGQIGDCVKVLRPGQKAFGRSYRYWRGLGNGRHEVRDDGAERDHA
jgi:hypothetical protein